MQAKQARIWAIGAVTLAVAIACSPPVQQADTGAEPPPAETEAIKVPPGTVAVPPPPASEPGYSGVWAPTSADCTDSTKAYLLTGQTLTLTPQSRTCTIKSLAEEHPTGRSAIYRLAAACISDPPTGTTPTSDDTFTLTFGASDTVMQMQVNSGDPMTLERCPVTPTP